jgi:hypothetical protein
MVDKPTSEEITALHEKHSWQYLELVEALKQFGELSTLDLREMGFFSAAVLVNYARSKGYNIRTEMKAISDYSKIAFYSLTV